MLVDRFPLHIDEEQEEDQILFPSYHEAGYFDRIVDVPALTHAGDLSTALPALKGISEASLLTEPTTTVADDTAIRKEPREHVDYLSHDWTEDDLSASWRSIVTKQAVHNNSQRLENASWRAWMKAKYQLKTLAPEILDWKKDSDVTWLYGPLHKRHTDIQARPSSSSGSSQASTPDGYQVQRPILKKRTLAETLLQRSFSACSIPQQAPSTPSTPKGPAVSFTNLPPALARPGQCYSAVSLNTPFSDIQSTATVERRRIQFNDSVSQCIALDLTHEPEDIQLSCAIYEEEDDDSSSSSSFSEEDDTTSLTLPPSSLSLIRRKSTAPSRPFLATRSKTIAVLPSTTLKTHEGSASASASASRRPSLSRGKPFHTKPEPEVLSLPLPPPPAPTKVLTPSRYFFRDVDEDGGKLGGLDWQTDGISSYENASEHDVELVPTLATPLNPYEAFKAQPQGYGYGACMHYDEDEHALLLELGCI